MPKLTIVLNGPGVQLEAMRISKSKITDLKIIRYIIIIISALIDVIITTLFIKILIIILLIIIVT